MKKLFVLVAAVLALTSLNASAEILVKHPNKNVDIVNTLVNNLSSEEGRFLIKFKQVGEALAKELSKNEEGYYDQQELYFFHQDLLYRVEDLNAAFLPMQKTESALLMKMLTEFTFKSPVLGPVTLLNVIERLEDFNWNSMGNVTVNAKELKAFLQSVSKK